MVAPFFSAKSRWLFSQKLHHRDVWQGSKYVSDCVEFRSNFTEIKQKRYQNDVNLSSSVVFFAYFENIQNNIQRIKLLFLFITLNNYCQMVWFSWTVTLYLTFTCSKSTIETLKKRVRYVQN